MNLSSPIFLFCFLPVVFILYRIIKDSKWRNILLSIASFIFYAFGQITYVPLLFGSILINYLSGLALKKKKSRLILTVSVLVNILILCVFKYAPELGISGIALPLGISFFTFQGLSYVIDCYRNPAYVTDDFLKIILYISFFPRLVAGPIVKYSDIVPQLDYREDNIVQINTGICRFCVGFAKKMLISYPLSKAADTIIEHYSSSVSDFRLAWISALSYMLQIYYDFSGYSDMAIGIGMMFGFRFPENFNHPYGAFSIREFWRKWHISLSSWFKEYVYIPLGGNRHGKIRASVNRFIVFVLTGIWHGANLTYLVWGIGHGLLSNLEDNGIIPVKKLEKYKAGKVILKIYTLLSVCLLFVIFRSSNISQGLAIIAAMFSSGAAAVNNPVIVSILTPAFLFTFIIAVVFSGKLGEKIHIRNTALKYTVCLVLFTLSVLSMAKSGSTPFIYAQF